jgi:hypothetical protein
VQVAPELVPTAAAFVREPNSVPELHDSDFVRRGHLAPDLSSTLSAPVLVLTQPWIVVAGGVLEAATDPAATPPGLRRRVLRMAAGNPLALLELPVALRLKSEPADGSPPGDLSLTSRLERAFAEQVSSLPMATRNLLLLAAADERALAPELLAAASMLSGSEVTQTELDPAEMAGLAALVDGSVVFRHPLVPSAIYQAATAERRRGRPSARRRAWQPPGR